MQKNALNLAAIIAAALLTACGGNSDEIAANVLVPSPTPPDAAETAAFNASKQGRKEIQLGSEISWQPYSISVNGHTIIRSSGSRSNAVMEKNFRSLPAGFAAYNGIYTDSTDNARVNVRSYQGFRSGVLALYSDDEFITVVPYGVPTPSAAIPTAGKATYNGIAFDHSERGNFTYHVDFAAKTGQGRVDGLSKYGDITLATGNITQERLRDDSNGTGIVGKASATKGSSFDYGLVFFGHRAEEITGYVANDKEEGIGLLGTRGAITE
ncbi:MAG: hypothetical protein D8H94_08650 [Cardiobacterium sp.]|jgi:hypothetical protein|nr:MAG: hypothetical protein D8H94_08650 [Cardiobacterium sp.]